jgi:hypothetical protein
MTRATPGGLALVLAPCLSSLAVAAPLPVNVPIGLEYVLIEQALREHLFTGDGASLTVSQDASGCNRLAVAEPHAAASGDGRMAVTLDVTLHGGTAVAGRCVLPFEWRGKVVLIETPTFGDAQGKLSFRITDSQLVSHSDAVGDRVPAQLWGGLKQFVHPRLEAFTVDLTALLTGAADLLGAALRPHPDTAAAAVASLALHDPVGRETVLEVSLSFVLPELPPEQHAPPPSPPLSPDELAAWDSQWQSLDAFVTWAVKTFAREQSGAVRRAFIAALSDARHRLRDALLADQRAPDPVRPLFEETWRTLTPLIARAARRSTSGNALRFVAFVNAGDALMALDAVGQQYGVRIDRDGLRTVARSLVATVGDDELAYTLAPDAELRELFGFDPDLGWVAPVATSAWYTWLLPAAWAAAIDPSLATELDGWVPEPADLDRYLAAMDSLFDSVIGAEAAKGKIESPFLPIFRTLVRATAWQESCWRQFVRRPDGIEAIRSRAGSVGLMQVNRHVWRGLYDLDALERDVGYNARAGSEILVHYLVDYAVRRKEHELDGGLDNLARATYAAYNGGPGHLRRYRSADSRPALRAIDEGFWNKYRAIRANGSSAVRTCYGDL